MTYVIALPCVDVKDRACVDECPVDCIYEGNRMLYIQPDECVDCGACEPVCPVEAIYYEDDTPDQWAEYYRANVEFFDDLGAPGGAAKTPPRLAARPPHPTRPACAGRPPCPAPAPARPAPASPGAFPPPPGTPCCPRSTGRPPTPTASRTSPSAPPWTRRPPPCSRRWPPPPTAPATRPRSAPRRCARRWSSSCGGTAAPRRRSTSRAWSRPSAPRSSSPTSRSSWASDPGTPSRSRTSPTPP